MILMLAAGLLGLNRLNIQFFPTFELDIINITVPWSGASAEDVQTSIVVPVEEVRGKTEDGCCSLSTAL
jgi:multidrug efflux pump subunit AcrB